MALGARREIIFVVAGRVAPIDARLAHRRDVCSRGGIRVRLMTVAAFRDRLCLFRGMRHEVVRPDLFSARGHIARGRRGELVERPVAPETYILGDFSGG